MSDTPTRAEEANATRSPIGAVRDWIKGLVRARHDATLRETLEELIEEPPPADDSAQVIDPQERVLIKNVLKLRGMTVGDVMVPRADIVAVEEIGRASCRERVS
jgi:CBS domain containing-hemolysin-like protein